MKRKSVLLLPHVAELHRVAPYEAIVLMWFVSKAIEIRSHLYHAWMLLMSQILTEDEMQTYYPEE